VNNHLGIPKVKTKIFKPCFAVGQTMKVSFMFPCWLVLLNIFFKFKIPKSVLTVDLSKENKEEKNIKCDLQNLSKEFKQTTSDISF
jgi:hypothetical protein